MKKAVTRLFNRFGYSLVPNWRLERYEQAAYLRRLFEAGSIDCVLDVGANVGQYADFVRNHLGFKGLIVSFEPVPQNVAILQARAANDRQWIIRPLALGSTCGWAKFNVMEHTAFSSFLEPDNSQYDFATNRVARTIDVEVSTLDTALPPILAEHRLSSVYLKMDTQGFDLEVVKGGQSCDIRALQSEMSICPIYRGMPDFAESIQTLQALGFVPSALFPVNYEAFPRLIEIDCHMVARTLCS